MMIKCKTCNHRYHDSIAHLNMPNGICKECAGARGISHKRTLEKDLLQKRKFRILIPSHNDNIFVPVYAQAFLLAGELVFFSASEILPGIHIGKVLSKCQNSFIRVVTISKSDSRNKTPSVVEIHKSKILCRLDCRTVRIGSQK